MAADLLLHCAECGIQFVWTAAEQADPERPTRCPACRRLAPPPGRQRGLVKWFSRSKGYGFITAVNGDEIFVHKTGLSADTPTLRAGQLVEFATSHTPRGAQAEQVIVLT